MKATDYGQKNQLRCPSCDDYRYLTIQGVRFEEKDRMVGMKIPFLECKNCKTKVAIVISPVSIIDNAKKAEEFYRKMGEEELKKLKPGEKIALISPFEKSKFKPFDSLGFNYDSQDYYYIPGLVRPWDEGYLCPVFFDKEVLLYYNNHNDYRVIFSSFSSVDILDKDNNPIIPHGFGINRYGKIICWLGDLHEEFSKPENKRHKDQFLTFNVDSDHDIVSDYYFSQIEANFMKSDNELEIFALRNEFDKKVIDLKGINITHVNLEDLIENYKHPILNETDQINNAYLKLNSLLIESLDVKNLKELILKSRIEQKEIEGLKGLKLFEKFVCFNLKQENASSIVSPLYVLYDLRVLAGHIKDSEYEKKIKTCKDRLNISENSTDIQVFESLIKSLIEMYQKLNNILNQQFAI